MKSMVKGLLCFIITFSLAASAVPAAGLVNDFPDAIWPPMESFTTALENGDNSGILKWGEVVIGIMEAEPDSAARSEFLAGKYYQAAGAAERLGVYDKAVTYYQKYIPYGEYMNWTDGVIYAKKKVYLLTPFLNVYIEDPSYMPPYYGAKFEPERGVYFGAAYDNDQRILDYNQEKIQQFFPKKNSMWLIYLEFRDDIQALTRYKRYFDEAKRNGIAVELAWNTYSSLEDIDSHMDYVKKTVDYLGDTGLTVFLRFANEMNIGPNGENPEAYIRAYQKVASYAKTKDNIAMVWAPNDLGALDRPYSAYYPGDGYVDWVGASLYVNKYFQGIKDHGSQTEALNTYFATGEFANPVMRIKELIGFMEEWGIKKPVMIAEGGVPHYIRKQGEDSTSWALAQMRRQYGDLIRAYPQIKAINYFDVQIPSEPNAYELYTSPQLNDLYNKMVANPYYLESVRASAPFGYRIFDGGVVGEGIELSAVGYYPKTLYNQVKYYIDGNLAGESYDSPYNLQLSSLSQGGHTLVVELYDNGEKLLSKAVDFQVEKKVRVQLDGDFVAFPDQQPVIVDNRTLVPARGVFEKMGMTVLWDEAKRQVTIQNAKQTITLVIDDRTMTVGDKKIQMDVPAQLINGRTMIPLRAVSEATGAKVDWDEAGQIAVITTK